MKIEVDGEDRTQELLDREFTLTPPEPPQVIPEGKPLPKRLQWALDALQNPKFGDDECVRARVAIEDERKAEQFRPKIIGRKITCGPCGGRPGSQCETCNNSGVLTITPEWAAELPLDIVEGIIEELEENRKEAARKRSDIPF